jgi:integrase
MQSNPMEETKAGGRTKKADPKDLDLRRRKIQASHEHAYTLEEVAEMLDKLPEPSRTVCAVAAFTGPTRSELRGLKWEDYAGETISALSGRHALPISRGGHLCDSNPSKDFGEV